MYNNPIENALIFSAEAYNSVKTLENAVNLVNIDNDYIISMYGKFWGDLKTEAENYSEKDYFKRADTILKELKENYLI